MAKGKWTREHLMELQKQFLGDDITQKDKRRARILKAATELFMAYGYRKTSVDEIARRAEVAKGTVYLHFENKADLLMHAVALEKQVLLTHLAPILDGEIEGEEKLRFYVRFMLTVARELPLVARLMSGDNEMMMALDDWGSTVLEARQSLGEEFLMSMLHEAAPFELTRAQRRERANVMITLTWFVVMLLDDRIRGGRSLDELADTMADVLVYGLVNRPPGVPGPEGEELDDEDED